MPIVGQFASLARAGSFLLPGGAFESIATVTVGSGGASSIEFTSIPGTYQHLQLRMVHRKDATGTGARGRMRVNGDTGSTYAWHLVYGDGGSTAATAASSQTEMGPQFDAASSQSASVFAAAVFDILDYANTSKNKTIRVLSGYDNNGSGYLGVGSGLWASTSAITSLLVYPSSGNWAQYTTASLYGLRAP